MARTCPGQSELVLLPAEWWMAMWLTLLYSGSQLGLDCPSGQPQPVRETTEGLAMPWIVRELLAAAPVRDDFGVSPGWRQPTEAQPGQSIFLRLP